MRIRYCHAIRLHMIKNFLLSFFLISSFCTYADVPIDRDFLRLPDGKWIWLKKIDVHKTWVMLGKGKQSERNRIWSKFYETDGRRHTWSYAFFIRLKKNKFILHDPKGPLVAISTYDMGNAMNRWAIIYRVLKNRLEIADEMDNFNVSADEPLLERSFNQRNLNPHFEITDLKRWVGKYPFHKIDGADIFSLKAVNDVLMKIMGEANYNSFIAMEENSVASPVRQYKNFVYIDICQAHACHHTFYFFVNLKTSEIVVCERDMANDGLVGVWARWYGSNGRILLDEHKCEILDNTNDIDFEKTIASIPKEIR